MAIVTTLTALFHNKVTQEGIQRGGEKKTGKARQKRNHPSGKREETNIFAYGRAGAKLRPKNKKAKERSIQRGYKKMKRTAVVAPMIKPRGKRVGREGVGAMWEGGEKVCN